MVGEVAGTARAEIVHGHHVVAFLEQKVDHVAPDEAAPTRDHAPGTRHS